MASHLEPAKRAVRVPRPGALYTFLALVVVAEVAALVARAQGAHLPPPAFWWPLYALAPVLAWSSLPRKRRTGRVLVQDAGVSIDGEMVARRAELSLGLVRREGDATWLRLSGKSKLMAKMVDVAVTDEDEAERILAVLGLDAKSRTAEFNVFSGSADKLVAAVVAFGVLGGVIAAGALLAGHVVGPAVSFAMMLAIALAVLGGALFAARTRQAKLTVGVDGLQIVQGFRRPRFVAHDAIREATANAGTLTLRLADGETLSYLCGQQRRSKDPSGGEPQKLAEAIVTKLRAARSAFDELAGDVGNVPALARARRSTSEWVAALRRIGEAADGGYREGMVPRERLLRVAESTHAPERVRIAAAVALAAGATTEEKERLHAAAEASASPELQRRLRVAVDPAAELALLERVLDEADDEGPAPKAARLK